MKKIIILSLALILIVLSVNAIILNPQGQGKMTVLLNATNDIVGNANVSFFASIEDHFNSSHLTCLYENVPLNTDSLCNTTVVRNELIDSNLVAYYKFDRDDSTGDSKGSIDLTEQNGIVHHDNKGVLMDAYLFNGVNHYLSSAGTIVDSDGFTASGWVKTTSFDDMKVLHIGGSGPLTVRQGLFRMCVDIDSCQPCTGRIDDGEWHFITAVVSLTESSCYIDGVFDRTDFDNPNPINGNVFIGKHATATQYFDGWIDEIRIYDNLLTAEEIANLYTFGEGTYYWKANATNATDTSDSSTQTFIKDFVLPVITITEPLYESLDGLINVSGADTNNMSMEVILNDVTVSKIINNESVSYVNQTKLARGSYNLTIILSDIALNTVTKQKLFDVIKINDIIVYSDGKDFIINVFSDLKDFIIDNFGGSQ